MVWVLGPSVFVILGFVYSLIECLSLSSFAFSVFLFPGFIHVPPPVFHVSCLVEFSCLLFPSFSVQSTFLSFSHVSCFNLIVPRLAFSFASSQFHVCVCVISPSFASLLVLIPLLPFEYLVLCLPLPVVIAFVIPPCFFPRFQGFSSVLILGVFAQFSPGQALLCLVIEPCFSLFCFSA